MNDLPPVRVPHPHVVTRPDLMSGSPFVLASSGAKVPVRRLWQWHRRGVSVDTLVRRYPTLGWKLILVALAFAYDNRDLVDADLDRERAILDSP